MTSNRADRETLKLAARYLSAAANPDDNSGTFLVEVSDVVKKLEQYGPAQGVLDRLAGVVSDLRDRTSAPCDVTVTLEGRHVVLRIACVPEEHPVLILE